jgi:nicotinamide phosphoribosyltransferase
MRVWYPTNIATLTREMKKIIHASLVRTGDETTADMKVVDFGSRGVTCKGQAQIGGAAHQINFKVTDNLLGMSALMDYYGDGVTVPSFSIPATEHSVTTSWGKDREFFFYNNIVRNILPKTGICSVVIDTYDTFGAIDMFGTLRSVIEENGVIVFRPDSGEPVDMTERVIKKLDAVFGSTVNDKGFKVLNPCARIIQGDGIDFDMIKLILDNFERLGYSADNIIFGSGGGLLQKVNRDTMRFAMKTSNVVVNMDSRDIQKVPATDMTKASKKGKLRLLKNEVTGEFRTVNQHDTASPDEVDMLETVLENGRLMRFQTWEEIRELAAI